MGIFDRIRDVVGDDGEGEEFEGSAPDPGVDRGAGTGREGDEGRKAGSHGSHWDALTANNAEVRDAVMTAVREGGTRDGVDVDGDPVVAHVYPRQGPIRTVAVSVDDELVTAFPGCDGVTHQVGLEGVTEWASGVEAQLEFELSGNRMAAFDTGFFFRGRDGYAVGTRYELDLGGFVYDLGPAEAASDEYDVEEPIEGVAAFVQFDGGDVDDYVFRSTVEGVEEHGFGNRTVYRIRVPLFRTDGRAVQVALYAAEHMTGGYVPERGDDVEGVAWLQGRIV